MLKKELAEALGISPAAVTKLSKRGMPTDTLERAQRWRRRHLEPSRVKGVRFEPSKAHDPGSDPIGQLGAAALQDFRTHERSIRALLQAKDFRQEATVRLPVGVWTKLVCHVLSEDAAARQVKPAATWVTCKEFAAILGSPIAWQVWFDVAKDTDEFSIYGFDDLDEYCGTHVPGQQEGGPGL